MLREYDYYAEAFRQNEEFGEKRVTSFLTLAAGAAAALGFILGDDGFQLRPSEFAAVAITSCIVLLFGQLTLARLIKRNVVSDEYKEALALVRAWFRERDGTVSNYIYHRPQKPPKDRKAGFREFLSGGWVETMFVTNSLLGAIFAAATAAALGRECTASKCLVPLQVAAAAALAVLVLNVWYADYRYKMERGNRLDDMPSPLQALRNRAKPEND